MTLTVLPFTAQLPAGYRFPTDAEGTATGTTAGMPASTPSTTPVDTVSFGNSWQAGSFTAEIGDLYRMSDLFHGSAPSGQAIAGYRVALGGGGDGTLLLNGDDVSSRTKFTADEFAHLIFAVGDKGLPQDLVVVAQTGTRLADGTLTHITDSPVVQITAKVGGARSIETLSALATPVAGSEAKVANIVTEAGIYTGFAGSSRPTLETAGNFTAAAGDVYRLGDLFHGSASTGQAIAGYRIALGGDGNGTLTLNGTDVSSRTSFTADEFAHLTYTVGSNGLAQNLVVVAQTGTRLTNGALTHITDSPAMQITADVTGARSINALPALASPAGADAVVATIASEASIYTGSLGHSRPTLQTVGNFTTAVGDTYRLNDLYQGNAPAGQAIAGYRVALGGAGNGTLWLNGDDVSDRTSFTADEFAHLTYIVGANGSPQNLVVVAQTGTRLTNNALTQITDSAAVQITAEPTGVRSINALKALATPLSGADARIASIASEAGIYTGSTGTSRPTLQTVGNFAAKAGDVYRVGDLFHGSAPAGSIAGYRVALAGDGNGVLLLNGVNVGSNTNFTADEFARLTYQVGVNGSPQTLVALAQRHRPCQWHFDPHHRQRGRGDRRHTIR